MTIVASPIQSLTYQEVIRDLDTIGQLNTKRGDKLTLKDGKLVIDKGGVSQAPKSMIRTAFVKGNNFVNVVECLDELTKKTIKAAECLSEDFENKYQEFRFFKRRLKKAIGATLYLYLKYQDNSRKETVKRLLGIRTEFIVLHDKVKEYMGTLKKPDESDVYVSDHKLPLSKRKIKSRMPKGATPSDIALLINTAREQTVSEIAHDVIVGGAAHLGLAIAVPAFVTLTLLQWTVLEPVEDFLIGETESNRRPTDWITDRLHLPKRPVKMTPDHACDIYTRQLLDVPLVTDEHVDYFCEFANNLAKGHDDDFSLGLFRKLEIGSSNIDELLRLASYDWIVDDGKNRCKPENFGENARIVLNTLIADEEYGVMTPRQFGLFLNVHYDKLQWLDNHEYRPTEEVALKNFEAWYMQLDVEKGLTRKELFLEDYRKRSKPFRDPREALITLTNFIRVVDAIGENPSCRILDFKWDSYAKIPEIAEVMQKHNFVTKIPGFRNRYAR